MSSKDGSAVAIAGRGRASVTEAVGEVERWASVWASRRVAIVSSSCAAQGPASVS